MKKLRVLFVVRTVDFIDPLGPMLLSAIAKRAGHETRLGIVTREDIFSLIREWQPDILAYSATTGEHRFYYQLNDILKRHFTFFSIMGGPHATFSPEEQPESSMDAFCRGEGDETFPELLTCLAEGHSIANLPNLVIGGKANPLRPLLRDLDQLPFPDRELFYDRTEMRDFPIKSFMASRGCPFPCTYCFNHQWNKLYHGAGPIVRRRSVANIIAELESVKARFPLGFVKFYDDIFAYRVDDWLREFVANYRSRIGLPFQCYTRANCVDEDLVLALKEAGCVSVSMSIEAGSHAIRRDLLKRDMSDEQLEKAFHLFHRHGIATFANTLLALPDTTFADDLAAVRANLDNRVTLGLFAIFHPYPKTELGDRCIQKGYFTPSEYRRFNTYYVSDSPLNCFSKATKHKQVLLSLWGTVAVAFPKLANVILSFGTHVPWRSLAFSLYYLVKGWLVLTRIYPARFSVDAMIRSAWKGWRLEGAMRGVEDLKELERRHLERLSSQSVNR